MKPIKSMIRLLASIMSSRSHQLNFNTSAPNLDLPYPNAQYSSLPFFYFGVRGINLAIFS